MSGAYMKMQLFLDICVVVCILLTSEARGPLCLVCPAVKSPDLCTNVTECLPGERCFSEQFIVSNGKSAFRFGCRTTEHCPSQDTGLSDLRLCQACCDGDVCNYKICRNGTAPPPGIPCLSCSDVPATNQCNRLTYCQEGEICYAQESISSLNKKFNMGCLNKGVCQYSVGAIIGRRSVKAIPPTEFTRCHICCEEPGCNYGSCSIPEESFTYVATCQFYEWRKAGKNPKNLRDQASNWQLLDVIEDDKTISHGPLGRDCWDLMTIYGINISGVYQVLLPSGREGYVRCDMTTDGGGWTVFQRRFDGHVSFNRTFAQYQSGFGDLHSEFWMGNALLHDFTRGHNQTLRVDLCSWKNQTRHAIYKTFYIGSASELFRLHVGNYDGDAGDALDIRTSFSKHKDVAFSTPDHDNDLELINCAQANSAGWWFSTCFSSNLNGLYDGDVESYHGVQWLTWLYKQALKGTEMKFRPSDVEPSSHSAFVCPVQ